MDIIINKIINKKEVEDEAYGIIRSYKKLMKNPHKKIIKESRRLGIIFGFILIYLIFTIYTSINTPKSLYFICLGIAILGFLIVTKRLIVYLKHLKIVDMKESNSILKVSEEKIELDNKVNNRCFSIEWKEIKQVLISDKCIAFMPELEKTKIKNVIAVPREYEKEVIEAIEKYNKKDLLAYNNR